MENKEMRKLKSMINTDLACPKLCLTKTRNQLDVWAITTRKINSSKDKLNFQKTKFKTWEKYLTYLIRKRMVLLKLKICTLSWTVSNATLLKLMDWSEKLFRETTRRLTSTALLSWWRKWRTILLKLVESVCPHQKTLPWWCKLVHILSSVTLPRAVEELSTSLLTPKCLISFASLKNTDASVRMRVTIQKLARLVLSLMSSWRRRLPDSVTTSELLKNKSF